MAVNAVIEAVTYASFQRFGNEVREGIRIIVYDSRTWTNESNIRRSRDIRVLHCE